MIKILMIVNSFERGGAEKFVISLTKNLSNNRIKLLNLKSLTLYDAKNCIYGNHQKINIFKLSKNFISALIEIIKFKPNIIHAHLYHSYLFAILVKIIFLKSKLFFTIHTNNVEGYLREYILYATKKLRFDILLTEKQKNWFTAKYFIINPGIEEFRIFNDIKQFNYSNNFNIGFVGRLVQSKRLDLLINLFNKNFPTNINLEIFGDGPLKKDLNILIKKKNLMNRIIINGFKKDIHEIYNNFELLIIPSDWEGFPLVIIEALIFNKVVLIRDTVANKININNFPMKERVIIFSEKNISSKLLETIKNFNKIIQINKNQKQELFKNFFIHNIANKHLEAYLEAK